MTQATAGVWQSFRSGNIGRAAKFYPNGRFSICGMEFDQNSSFKNTRMGDAEINKAAGVGQLLTIAAPGKTFVLRYESDDGLWYYQGEMKKGFLARLFGL